MLFFIFEIKYALSIHLCSVYVFYLHMCEGIESGSVEVELLLQSLRWEELTSRQRCGEAHVEHPPCFRIRLHVKHEHIIRRH